MVVLQFSDKAARTLEAVYASADVVAQRRATLDHLALAPGKSIVDIGCGPGFLCEEMAEAVGESGRVLGVDVSDDLLTFARERNTRQWLAYEQGDARQLALPDASFDAAVSVQTLEYIDDADRAIGEMFRVLKPGGLALVVNTDWDRVAWYSSDQARMARVRQAWEAHCAHPRLPQTLVPRLRAAGFTISAARAHAEAEIRELLETTMGKRLDKDCAIKIAATKQLPHTVQGELQGRVAKARETERQPVLHRDGVWLLYLRAFDRHPLEEAIDRHDAAALAICLTKHRQPIDRLRSL